MNGLNHLNVLPCSVFIKAFIMKIRGQMLSLPDLTGHKDHLIMVKVLCFIFSVLILLFVFNVSLLLVCIYYMHYAFKNENKGCNGQTITN